MMWPRRLCALALFIAGVWFFNLAAYHSWVAGGPPASDPQSHRTWAYILGVLGVSCWALALVAWRIRSRAQRRSE